MERRRLGSSGPEVGALGLGCMGMSWAYGPADEGRSVATIQATLEAGVDCLTRVISTAADTMKS